MTVSTPPGGTAWAVPPGYTPSTFERLVIEANWATVRRQLARGMTHELRGPLHALLLATQNLDPQASGEELALLLRIVDGAATRMREASDWLAEMSQGPSFGAEGPVILSEVLPQVMGLARLYRETKVEPEAVEARGLPAARGIHQAIAQALLNLILNGCDAASSGDGGVGSVRVEPASAPPSAIEIAVVDDGPGVPAEDRERVFEPFYTTKGPARLGLGLSATRYLLARFGATVSLDPGPARGARFVIRLPIWET